MRYESIKNNLKYSESKIQELFDLAFDSQIKNEKIKNISQLVGDILSSTTECFDYCARDIFETLILPNYAKISDKYIYYPFHTGQLEIEPWSLLKITSPELHLHLSNIASKSDLDLIPHMSVPYSYPKHIRKLVTNKKHNDVIGINNKGNPELVGSFSGKFKTFFPLKQIGITEKEIDHESMKGQQFVINNSYELKNTGEEVKILCQSALWSSRFILEDIYENYLRVSR